MNQKSKFFTMLLCLVFGVFGIHRFYTGKFWTGALYLFTGGLAGVGVVFDMICILLNTYKSKENDNKIPLKNDIPTFVIVLLFILWLVIVFVFGALGILGSIIGAIFGAIGSLFALIF